MSYLTTKTRRRWVAAVAVVAGAVGTIAAGSPAPAAEPSFHVIKTVDVAVNPFGDTTSPDGRTVWVANCGPLTGHVGAEGHTVTVLHARTDAVQSVIDVGVFPEDIAFTHHGQQAFVTNSTSDTVSVIDTATRRVTQTIDLSGIPITFPFGVIGTLDSRKVYVVSIGEASDRTIAVLDDSDPARVTLASTITLPGFGGRPALTPDGRTLVVPFGNGTDNTPRAVLIDTRTDHVFAQLTLAGGSGASQAVTVTPDGRFAYVSIFGYPPAPAGTVWVIDLARRATKTVIPTPDSGNEGINISPNGRFVFVTDFLTAQVSVIDTHSNQIIVNIPVGSEPNETAFTPDGHKAFVTNQGDTTVSVVSIP